MRKVFSEGPTGAHGVDLGLQHLVRYWLGEFGVCEEQLRDAVTAVGKREADVRRYFDRQRRERPAHRQGARP